MNAVINISRKDLAVSKTLLNFVMSSPKTIISIFAVAAIFYAPYSAQAGNHGYQIPANCCTAKSVIVFGETGGDSLFYIHTSNFHSQMPKTMENLSRTAIGASCSTANVRKLVTSKTQQLSPTLYRITMQLFAPITGADGRVRGCGISHTADCCASSEREAIGLALISARAKYRAFDGINARSVILS